MNNQENKNKQQQNGKETSRGNAPQNSFWKSAFAKRWTFPVIYLAASVLIVGLMYAKSQDAEPYKIDQPGSDVAGPAAPSNDVPAAETNTAPSMIWPVGEGGEEAAISMDYFRETASEADQAAAVVSYNKTFTPHQGVDLGLKSDKSFGVVAAAKGKVINVSEDPLMGNVIEIDHGNGYTTYYASLTKVQVEKGANVIQGQPIAMSGNSKYEVSEQNHVHFEIRKDGNEVDPFTMLSKKPMLENSAATHTDHDGAASTNAPIENQGDASNASTPAENSSDKKTGTEESSKPSATDGQDKTSTEESKKSTSETPEGGR